MLAVVCLLFLTAPGLQSYLLSSSPGLSLFYPGPAHLSTARVICPVCSCDDDYSCGCTTSLGCARNCAKCGGDFSQPSDPQPGCVASSGPAAGSACIFPFIYEGVRYEGCAPLIGGLSNLYSSLYWCSTKVDINGFHIRGPYDNRGKYVGFCDDTCPKISGTYYWI